MSGARHARTLEEMIERAWSGGPVALVCLLVACGGDDDGGGATIDAADSTDAAPEIDAVPIDAPPPMVSVRVESPMGPFAGAIVLVLDASDQVATSTTTDASGAASAVLPSGGKVIVAQSTTANAGFLWLAPEPGDVLRVNVAPGLQPPARSATVTVPAVSGSSGYRAESPCGAGYSATNTITYAYRELPGCASHDLRVTREVSSSVVGAFYVADQTVTDGGTIDLQARSWSAPVSRTANITGLPDTVASVQLTGQLAEGGHTIAGSIGTNLTPSGGAATASGTLDDVPSAQLYVRASWTEGSNTQITLGKVGAQNAGTLDAAALRTHDVTLATYDNNTDVVTWTETATGAAPHGAYIRLDYGGPQTLFGGNGLTWNVIAPPGGTLTMPVIPAALPNHSVANRSNTYRTVNLFRHSSGAAFVRQRAFAVRAEVDLLPDGATLAQSSRSFGAL
jgi:hypothetical protein